jgi:polar amino acid transport system substrate-binding protein
MRKKIGFMGVAVAVVMMVLGSQLFAAGKNLSSSPVLNKILSNKELVVGTAAGMPPLNMKTKDGKIIGLEVDLANDIATAMGVKLTLKTMPFNDLLPALEGGKVDMVLSGMTMNPTRNLKVAFAGPYFDSGKSLLAKLENVQSINSMEKMNNPDKTLVALKGSTSQLFAENALPKAKLVLAEDYDQAVAMIRNDKAIAMVADFPICAVSILRYPEAKLGMSDKPFTYEPIGIALPPTDTLMINWVQNFLNAMDRIGGLKKIEDRWLKNADWITRLP